MIQINNDQSISHDGTTTSVDKVPVNEWFHMSFTWNDDNNQRYIYLNGVQLNNTPGSYTSNNLKFTSFTDFLLDEVKVYNRVLNETELKLLAGKLFLDLSGNRLNGVPMGNGFSMVSTAADDGVVANSLTESVISSDLGNAINLDGARYIDISNHSTELLSLRTGSIAFWINPQQTGNEMSIFSASDSEDNGTYYRLFLNESGFVSGVFQKR